MFIIKVPVLGSIAVPAALADASATVWALRLSKIIPEKSAARVKENIVKGSVSATKNTKLLPLCEYLLTVNLTVSGTYRTN